MRESWHVKPHPPHPLDGDEPRARSGRLAAKSAAVLPTTTDDAKRARHTWESDITEPDDSDGRAQIVAQRRLDDGNAPQASLLMQLKKEGLPRTTFVQNLYGKMDMFFDDWDQGLVPKARKGHKDADDESETQEARKQAYVCKQASMCKHASTQSKSTSENANKGAGTSARARTGCYGGWQARQG